MGNPTELIQPEIRRKSRKREVQKLSEKDWKARFETNTIASHNSDLCTNPLYTECEHPVSTNIINFQDKNAVDKPLITNERRSSKGKVNKDTILLKDRNGYKGFKLFKENELPNFQNSIYKVNLHEVPCDNDYQTDDEQILHALSHLETALTDTMAKYESDSSNIRNIKKYKKIRDKIKCNDYRI